MLLLCGQNSVSFNHDYIEFKWLKCDLNENNYDVTQTNNKDEIDQEKNKYEIDEEVTKVVESESVE